MGDPERPRNDDTAVSGAGARRPRKAYVKPAFRFEKVFETTALACGKVTSTQSQCRLNRKVS